MRQHSLRRRCFDLLADGREAYSLGHRFVSAFILLTVAACAAAIMAVTMPGITPETVYRLDRLREATDIIFTIEYLLRIWIAPDYAGDLRLSARVMRLRYLRSFHGIADLLVILPFFLHLLLPIPREWFLVLEMFTLFKLARYAPGLNMVAAVLRREARAMVAAFLALGVILVLAACIMYVL
ncbi:ion transporter, partial [Ferrovibrio sp.]